MLSNDSFISKVGNALTNVQREYFKSQLNTTEVTSYILPTQAIEVLNPEIADGCALSLANLLISLNPVYSQQSKDFWCNARKRWLFNQGILLGSLAYAVADNGFSLYTASFGLLEQLHQKGLLTSKYIKNRQKFARTLGVRSTDSGWYRKMSTEFESNCTEVYAIRLDPKTESVGDRFVVRYEPLLTFTSLNLNTTYIVPILCFNTARTCLTQLLQGNKYVEVVTPSGTAYYTNNSELISKFYGEGKLKGLQAMVRSGVDRVLAVRLSNSGSSPVKEIDLTTVDRITLVENLPADLKFSDYPIEYSRRYLIQLSCAHENDVNYLKSMCSYLFTIAPFSKYSLRNKIYIYNTTGITSGVNPVVDNGITLDYLSSADLLKLTIRLIGLLSDRRAYHLIAELSDLKNGISSTSFFKDKVSIAEYLRNCGINRESFLQNAKHLWSHTDEYMSATSKMLVSSLLASFLCEVTYITTKDGSMSTMIATNNPLILGKYLPKTFCGNWETSRTRLIGLKDSISDSNRLLKMIENAGGEGRGITLDTLPRGLVEILCRNWDLDLDLLLTSSETVAYNDLMDALNIAVVKTEETAKDFYGRNDEIVMLRCVTALDKSQYIRSVNYKNIVKIERLNTLSDVDEAQRFWQLYGGVIYQEQG